MIYAHKDNSIEMSQLSTFVATNILSKISTKVQDDIYVLVRCDQ